MGGPLWGPVPDIKTPEQGARMRGKRNVAEELWREYDLARWEYFLFSAVPLLYDLDSVLIQNLRGDAR
jgi:hypothetical protein